MGTLNLLHVEISTSDVNDAIDSICSIADNDCDFNGENGEEYLWEEAKEKGFENNLDFTINHLEDKFAHKDIVDFETICEICKEFFELWLDNDGYYEDYNYDIIETDGDSYILVLTYLH